MIRRGLIFSLALVLPGLLVPLGAYLRTDHPPAQAPDPIARVQAISYDEAAPYFDALFVWRADGKAWFCSDDNLDELPENPVLRWLARETVPSYLDASRDEGVTISASYRGPRVLGGSPWGAFEQSEIRALTEPSFEEAKRRFIEILRVRRAGEEPSAVRASQAQRIAAP